MILILILAAVVTAGTNVMSEEYSILVGLHRNPLLSPNELLEQIREKFPDTTWDEMRVSQYKHDILLPSSVPLWLHEAILRFDTVKMNDYRESNFINSLIQSAPKDEDPIYRNMQVMGEIAHYWTSFCANRSRLFPKGVACYTMTFDGKRFVNLSPVILTDYFGFRIMQEHNRMMQRKRSREGEEGARKLRRQADDITTSPTPLTLSQIITGQLLRDPSVEPEDILTEAKILYPNTTLKDVTQQRILIMSPTSVPSWLHDTLWFHRKEFRSDNREMLAAIAKQRPKNHGFPTGLDNVIMVWNKYCIQPLAEYYENEDESKELQVPCLFDRKESRLSLADSSLRKYLTDLSHN
jgi:hypothetical protein